MSRFGPGLLTVALALAAGACFQHTYNVGAGAPEGEIVYRHWHHHWLFGLIRPELQKQLELDKFCPSGNATIHQEVSFVNGLVDVLIGFIYSPTTVEIRCDDGTKARLELDEQEVAAIVSDPRFLDVVLKLAPERLEETRTAQAGLRRTAGAEARAAPAP